MPLLAAFFATKRADAWLRRMRKSSIPCSAVQGPLEALRSEAAGDLVGSTQHPRAGQYEFAGYPVIARGKRIRNDTAPPLLGQQTVTILRELGYSTDDVAKLLATGAAASAVDE